MGLFDKLFGKKGEEEQPLPEEEFQEVLAEFEEEDELPGEAPAPEGRQPILRIEIDRESCTGMAECIKLAPGVFELDEEGKCVVVDASAATRDQILKAAHECPSQAIRLYELDGTKIYPDWM